jgi:uncharacterized protein YkwD
MTAANKIILISAVLLLGGFATVWMTTPPAKDYSQIVTPAPAPVTPPTVDELFKLVNEERAKQGVAALVLDERLNKSAQQKADDMFNRNYFDHSDPEGRRGATIAYEFAPDICGTSSENLTWGKYKNTSFEAIRSWKASKPHYDAMVNAKYVYTGLGVSGDKIVQHFC